MSGKQILQSCIDFFIKDQLPLEWLINLSEKYTCQGRTDYIRIESEPKQGGRQLICVIQTGDEDNRLVITTPSVQSPELQKVIKIIKETLPFDITIVECSFDCENCQQVWEKYH